MPGVINQPDASGQDKLPVNPEKAGIRSAQKWVRRLRPARDRASVGPARVGPGAGFSLLELMVSVAIILLLMSAVFPFIAQSQKTFQGNESNAEANQSARAALEVISQEIGQAGYNPNFNSPRYSSTLVSAAATPQCVTINSPGITKIDPGDWFYVDSGPNEELVQVLSTSAVPSSPCAGGASANKIYAVFSFNHCVEVSGSCTAAAYTYPIISYKMPYGVGIVAGSGDSTDRRLEFFGDIESNSVIQYIVYSLNPVTPTSTVLFNGTTYTLYNLYRSETPVTFANLPGPGYVPPAATASQNNAASVLVANVLYNTTNASGPTGQPIFGYPNTVTIGIIPNVITVVDTITITLSVDVTPINLATGQHQWITMATQVRPINLNAAIAVNNAGGVNYLPLLPKTLPMTNPTSPPYYQ
jgi:prepilin-type N-terminal cleavage/methylation domain-containing protein